MIGAEDADIDFCIPQTKKPSREAGLFHAVQQEDGEAAIFPLPSCTRSLTRSSCTGSNCRCAP